MNTRSILTTLAVAMFLSAPLAAAEWKGRGFYEPDTALDITNGMMWPTPDTTDGPGKVYFSAFSGYFVLSVNQNVATTGSNVMAYPSSMHAFLGIWKDCNKDGYIGMPEGAVTEYASALLLDASACPQGGAHNDGVWVREYLPIGPDYRDDGQTASAANNSNPYNVADEGALIWGDWGLPTSDTKASCPVNPRPRGTYQSTGGFLRYADCFSSWKGTGAVNTVASATGLSMLSFADARQERPDESGSILNQANPYGQEDDATYARVVDCDAEPTLEVKDPTGGELPTMVDDIELTDEDGNYLVVRAISPAVDPSGSAYGTGNETEEALIGSCDRTDDDGSNFDLYDLDEADFEGTTAKRTQTDVYYSFFEGGAVNRVCDGGDPNSFFQVFVDPFLADESTCIDLSTTVPQGTPSDGGQAIADQLVGSGTWFGAPGYVASRNPYVSRETLQPWGAVYFTAYAYVTPEVVPGGLPGSGTGTYGSPHCNGLTDITGSFNCDPAKWWLSAGQSIKTDFQVVPGQSYNLIDIDCYDASAFKGSPVTTSLLGGDTCRR